MKLFGLLRKPAWENKDAAVRLQAVRSGQDAGLLALLPELAQRDPDPDVRAAALRRIDDVQLLARRLRGEHEVRVAQAARERLVEQLCGGSVAGETALALLAEAVDAELIQTLAERAPDADLRRAALERIQRPGFLFDRCLADPDSAIRRWLLQRIDSPEVLARLAEAARKRDKGLSRAARERLDALRLAAGDPQALAERALALCERLERLCRELPADREARLSEAQADWAALQERVDAALRLRVEGYLQATERALAGARGEPLLQAAPEIESECATESDQASRAEPDPEPDPELDRLLAALPPADAEDLEARLVKVEGELCARAEAQPDNPTVAAQRQRLETALAGLRRSAREHRESAARERIEALTARVASLEEALREGNLAQARDLRAALEGETLDRSLLRRLAQADARLDKLGNWQRWSGNKARARLCDEAEALHGSGLHPDAVATRVKELQAEWTRLDGIDGAAAPAPESGLARRFRALCHRALAPARPYFEKRRELQNERAGQIEGVLASADPAAIQSPAELTALRRQIVEALRALDGVAPQKRAAQGRALRARLGEIDAALAAAREVATLAKRRLIARLRRDLGQADPEAASGLAQQIQAEWKALPRSDRASEDALWAELRTLVDPVFAVRREREDAERRQQAEAEAAAQAVLDELDALATADEERLQHAEAHLDALSARWRALAPAPAAAPPRTARGGREERRPPPRRTHPLEPRFDAAVARVQAVRARALAARERLALEHVCAAGTLLDRLDAAPDAAARDALRSEFEAIALPADARAALAARAAGSGGDGSADAARRLAVRAELAAGLESPAPDLAIRREEQRLRLAAKLGGETLPAPRKEIRTLLIALQAQPEPKGERAALQARILQALAHLG